MEKEINWNKKRKEFFISKLIKKFTNMFLNKANLARALLNKSIILGIFLLLLTTTVFASIVSHPAAQITNGTFAGGIFIFPSAVNITGNVSAKEYLNFSGELEWIMPVNIFDVDKEDIETDLNVFVDIAGDNMVGNLTCTKDIKIDGYYYGDGSRLTNINSTGFNTNSSAFWDNLDSPLTEWLSTFNSTYHTWAYNQTIPSYAYTDTKTSTANLHLHALSNLTGLTNTTRCDPTTGKLINITLNNGVLYGECGTDATGGTSGNYFNQQLNTTSNVTFNNITISTLNSASCDVKSTTLGNLYCGTDATGAGGNGNIFINYTTVAYSTTSNTVYTLMSNLITTLSASSTYLVNCYLFTYAAAATTGERLRINTTGTPLAVTWVYNTQVSATTRTPFQGVNTASNALADTGSGGASVRDIGLIQGYIKTNTNPSRVTYELTSEISASNVAVDIGSYCQYTKVA